MDNKTPQLEDILVDKISEDELLEVPLNKRVFTLFLSFLFIIVSVVSIQFFNISIFNYDFYDKSASANFSRYEVERAPRGIINDRNGEPLLQNEPSFKTFLSFNRLPKDEKSIEEVLIDISKKFNLSQEELFEEVKNHDWTTGRFLIKTNISHDELVSISSYDIPGLDIEPSFSRNHYHPLAFSHILGYTGLVTKPDIESNPDLYIEDVIGKTGLEYFYDNYLRGVNGRRIRITNAIGETQESNIVNKPIIGNELDTFIDRDLQVYFYERLKQQIDALGTNAGAVGLAVNPQNGEVLALINLPSYNINNIKDYLFGDNEPLFNRSVSGVYNPGSTVKPLVAIAGLEEGVIDDDDTFYSPGYLEIPNRFNPSNPSRFMDWKPHGWVDVYSALARSSNVYFYITGGGYEDTTGLGISRLNKWWHKFNLGDKTEIDIPGESIGLLPDPEWKEEVTGRSWLLGDTYNVSIGQGDFAITPLGLINYISSIANRGEINQLRVSKKQERRVLKDISNDISENTFNIVEQGMIDAVEKSYGTANSLSNLPISIAAKTGSAEVGINKSSENAFFIGYAPVENPEIAILVLIENSQEGSLNAVPVARDVFMWYYENQINKP
ncbi:MAG: penicillin-binding transpeptidase domain-containing protein [Candidatus Paceibacterota bacterium]